MSQCKHDDHLINYNGVGRSARIGAVGCEDWCHKLATWFWESNFLSLGCSERREWDGVTLEVKWNDYHLEHWGLRREGPGGAWVLESPGGQCRQ